MDLVLMMTGSVFTGLLTIVMAPIMPQVTEHFGDHANSRLMAQMLMVLPAVGVVCAGPIMGGLIDRRGIRAVLIGSASLYLICGLFGLFTESIAVLVGSRVLLGVAGSGIYACSFALIGERFDGGARRSILGFKGAVGAGGATAVMLSAGFIAQAWGWRSVFALYLLALPILLMALGLERGRPATLRARTAGTGSLLPMWPILLLLIVVFSLTYTPLAQGSHLLATKGLVRPATIAGIIACSSAAYMVASASYGFASRRLGAPQTFRTGLLLFGLGLGGLALTRDPIVLAGWMIVMGFGNGMTAPYLHNLVLEKASPEVRGRAAGFVSPSHYAGEFINPPIFQLLSAGGEIVRAFLILAVGSVVGGLLLRPERWGRGRKSVVAQAAQSRI